MKPIKLLPKKTPKGWRINVPPILSENGKRQRFFFASRDEAEQFILPIRKKYRSGSFDTILSPSKSLFAHRAFELLGDRPPEELFQAVKSWLKQREQECASVTFSQACEAFVASPYKAHLTETYRKYFLFYSKRFSTIATKLLVKISTQDLLREFSQMTPSARNTTKSHLSSLWTFSIKRGWATENPLKNLERLHTPRPKIHILTAKQLRRLFVATIRLHPELVPLIAIQTFAGVRPLESVKLCWDNVDMEDAILTIPDPSTGGNTPSHWQREQDADCWFGCTNSHEPRPLDAQEKGNRDQWRWKSPNLLWDLKTESWATASNGVCPQPAQKAWEKSGDRKTD
jgi:hypothetical protein